MALWMCLVDFGVQNTCLTLTWLWKDLESDQSNHPWSDWGRNGEVHHKHKGFINNLLGFKLICHSLVQVFRLTAWFVVDMSTYFLKVISQLLTGGKKTTIARDLSKFRTSWKSWMTEDSEDFLVEFLVGGWPTPLKNMTSSVGVTIPNIWKNKKWSTPPTRFGLAWWAHERT